MGRNTIQFQKGLSVPEFLQLYGTEVQCEEALAKIRWPNGFRCPRCEGSLHGLVYGQDSSAINAGNADIKRP